MTKLLEILFRTDIDYSLIDWFIANALDGKSEYFYAIVYPLCLTFKIEFDVNHLSFPSKFNMNYKDDQVNNLRTTSNITVNNKQEDDDI